MAESVQVAVAGTAVPFTISVANRDSSACTASTFDLTDAVPSGWTAVLSSISLSIAPGASGSTTLLVTSPTSATSGSYPITATAKNRTATSYSGSASPTYVVTNTGSFSDDFDGLDSPVLGSAWLEAAGDLAINGNMLKNTLGVAGKSIAVVTMLSGPTQTVDADFTSVDNNLGPRFGIVLRYQDSQNYYLLYRATGGSSRLLISRFIGGVETILAAVGIANPVKLAPFHLTARVTGNALSLDLDGVNKVNAGDSFFSSGKVGIMLYNIQTTVQQEVDNFTAIVQ